MQPQAPPTIIVKVVEPVQRGLGLGDVILNAIGLTGVLAIGAVVFGLLLAGVVIGYRRMRSSRITDEQAAQTQSLGLTPPAQH